MTRGSFIASVIFIINVANSIQQCPNINWIPIGSYCYLIKNATTGGNTMQQASTACALKNSSLPVFKNETEYALFKQYWVQNNLLGYGFGFWINLHYYSQNWTWMDTGSQIQFHDFYSVAALNNFAFPCVLCSFNFTQGWTGKICTAQLIGHVCQTHRTDIPQQCYQMYRSCGPYPNYWHRFTLDSMYSTVSGYNSETAKFVLTYAFNSYMDGFTVGIYEMVSPGGATALAYGLSGMNSLLNQNYTLNRVAFYLPLFYLTNNEQPMYMVSRGTPPFESMLTALAEYQSVIVHNGFYWVQNVSTYPSIISCTNLVYDCNYTTWSKWSSCTVTCGGGLQSRTRSLVHVAVGRNCSNSATTSTMACNIATCTTQTLTSTSISHLSPQVMNQTGLSAASANPMSLATTIQDIGPYTLSSMTVSEKMALGFTPKENIITCVYDQNLCNTDRDFKTIYDPSLGNCFTFNYPDNPFYYVSRAGDIHGLTILLNSSGSDYTCSSMSEGFRVSIHNSTTYPFVDNTGYLLTPGYITSVSMMQINTTLLGPPYGTCVSSNNAQSDYYYDGVYTVEGCLRSCYQKQVIAKCGCGDPRFGIPSGQTYCNISQKRCVGQLYECASNFTSNCDCPLPCNDVTYAATNVKAKLYNSPFILEYCANSDTRFSDCVSFGQKNFAILKVSFQTTRTIMFEEQPSYQIPQVLSDFSNVVGLFLGASVVIIPEIFALISIILHICLCSNKVK